MKRVTTLVFGLITLAAMLGLLDGPVDAMAAAIPSPTFETVYAAVEGIITLSKIVGVSLIAFVGYATWRIAIRPQVRRWNKRRKAAATRLAISQYPHAA